MFLSQITNRLFGMKNIRFFLTLILCCTSITISPFWDELYDFFGFDNEYDYCESQSQRISTADNDFSLISPDMLHGYSRLLRLKGVAARKNIPGFYHHESQAFVPLEEDWKCGLHMLYNMCEIERIMGISDITDDEFIFECERVPDLFNERGSYAGDLKKAARYIACSPLYIIEHNDESQCIDIVYGSSNEKTFWKKITNELEKPGAQCVHFGCLIYDEDVLDDDDLPECHIFLISVVKLEDGSRALYLLDNMNYEASRSARKQMRKHVDYIHNHVFYNS